MIQLVTDKQAGISHLEAVVTVICSLETNIRPLDRSRDAPLIQSYLFNEVGMYDELIIVRISSFIQ